MKTSEKNKRGERGRGKLAESGKKGGAAEDVTKKGPRCGRGGNDAEEGEAKAKGDEEKQEGGAAITKKKRRAADRS